MDLRNLHLGRPVHRGPLTLFPVWDGRAVAQRGYLLAAGAVHVAERGGTPVVGQLVVSNPAPRPALVLEGDLLEGGHQHRVANCSVMVPAQQTQVLDVSCVEQGRWHGGQAHRSTRRRAPMEVRAALAHGQHEVWRRVDRYSARHGRNDTGSLLHAADRAADRAAAVVAGLQPLSGQCGVLVGLAGQPLLLECFDSPRTLRAVWEPLLRSVALDALTAEPVPTPGRRARRFLERLAAAPVEVVDAAGEGRAVASRSPYAKLRGLLWRDRLVHTAAVNVRHELVTA